MRQLACVSLLLVLCGKRPKLHHQWRVLLPSAACRISVLVSAGSGGCFCERARVFLVVGPASVPQNLSSIQILARRIQCI